jgi:hypothetical protein
MKSKIWLFSSIMMFMVVSSCTKNNTSSTTTTQTMIQYKWTLVSSSLDYPKNPSLNRSYTGMSTDFYLFDKDDSLTMQQAGTVVLPGQPLNYKLKYTVENDKTLIFGGAGPAGIYVNIVKLNDTLLVLSNVVTASYINADNSVTVYDGTKTDSLKR